MAEKKKRKRRSGPGVRIEEVPTGMRSIEAGGTAVAAFVGFARSHPVYAAVTVLVAGSRPRW
jgi:phage tail sheath protein FI